MRIARQQRQRTDGDVFEDERYRHEESEVYSRRSAVERERAEGPRVGEHERGPSGEDAVRERRRARQPRASRDRAPAARGDDLQLGTVEDDDACWSDVEIIGEPLRGIERGRPPDVARSWRALPSSAPPPSPARVPASRANASHAAQRGASGARPSRTSRPSRARTGSESPAVRKARSRRPTNRDRSPAFPAISLNMVSPPAPSPRRASPTGRTSTKTVPPDDSRGIDSRPFRRW